MGYMGEMDFSLKYQYRVLATETPKDAKEFVEQYSDWEMNELRTEMSGAAVIRLQKFIADAEERQFAHVGQILYCIGYEYFIIVANSLTHADEQIKQYKKDWPSLDVHLRETGGILKFSRKWISNKYLLAQA